MPDVQALRVFLAVAEKLSFTRAAEGLLLTQSAVSHQIAKLERETGVELMLREGRGISLTPAGEELRGYARRILGLMDEATDAVRRAGRLDQGRLRIGAAATACQYIIPDALREFRECFPDYALSILPGDSPQLVERLLGGELDLAILIRPERQSKLAFHDLMTDELRFLVNPLHPWARAGKVDRRQLGEQRMVLYGRGSTTARMAERYFGRAGVTLRDPIELPDMGAIKELVKLGLGVSLMAEWVVAAEVKAGSLALLPVPGARLRRRWSVAAAATRRPSVAEQTFIGLAQSVAAGLSRGGKV